MNNLAKLRDKHRWRFTSVALTIVALEAALTAWPIVATVHWGNRAVDTWIHFLWPIRAFLLLAATIQNKHAPWKLHAKSQKGTDDDGFFGQCVGLTASCEFSLWILTSVIMHALLSAIVLLLVAVLKAEFSTTLQWGLSIGFSAFAIVESIGSPIVITIVGLGPKYGPLADPERGSRALVT